MTKIYAQTVVFLLLLSFIFSAPLLNYDPRESSATVTLLKRSSHAARWLYKREISGSFKIEAVFFDAVSSSPTNKISIRIY
jgi:hypothetical protein